MVQSRLTLTKKHRTLNMTFEYGILMLLIGLIGTVLYFWFYYQVIEKPIKKEEKVKRFWERKQ
jgi:Na+/melibiose symporter-like transporter